MAEVANRWKVVLGALLIQLCRGAAAAFLVFPPHRDEATKPFSVHGFLHNAHLWEEEGSPAR